MKELSIEEKAKRYDEAIKVAKSNYETIVQMDNDCTFAKEGIVNTFHHIFPELAESEDERIRKALIKYLDALDDDEIRYGVSFKDMRTWLEKQGEQKPKYRVGDIIKYNQKQNTIIGIDTEHHCYDLDNDECVDFDTADYNFELVEQKTTEWSEEDEKKRKRIMHRLSIDGTINNKDLADINDWLKSLKERVQPQPRQE